MMVSQISTTQDKNASLLFKKAPSTELGQIAREALRSLKEYGEVLAKKQDKIAHIQDPFSNVNSKEKVDRFTLLTELYLACERKEVPSISFANYKQSLKTFEAHLESHRMFWAGLPFKEYNALANEVEKLNAKHETLLKLLESYLVYANNRNEDKKNLTVQEIPETFEEIKTFSKEELDQIQSGKKAPAYHVRDRMGQVWSVALDLERVPKNTLQRKVKYLNANKEYEFAEKGASFFQQCVRKVQEEQKKVVAMMACLKAKQEITSFSQDDKVELLALLANKKVL